MTLLNWGALAGALLLAGATVPAATVHARTQEPLVRAMRVLGGGGHLGISVRDVEASDAKDAKAGVVIEDVSQGGPADKAGMKSGDTITEFDGERVRSTVQFTRLVRETPDGRSVPVVLSRGGQRVAVTVTPDRAGLLDDFGMRFLDTPSRMLLPTPALPTPPAPPRAPRAVRPSEPLELFSWVRSPGRLGITMENLDTQLAEYFGVKDGVLVKSVNEGSAAAKAGLKAGDVITSINGRHIYDSSDVTRALDRIESTGEFTLDVTRDRKTQTLKGKIEAPATRTRVRTRTIV